MNAKNPVQKLNSAMQKATNWNLICEKYKDVREVR